VSDLSSPLTVLRGVGPALAKRLTKLDLHRVEDLLFLLPMRYEDRTTLHKIGSLQPGLRGLTCGEVLLAETVYRGRRSLLVRIGDGTGQLTLRFFYFSRQQQAQFQPGITVTCYGDVRPGPTGPEMVHPEYRVLKPDQPPAVSDALTPVYRLTEGVQQGRIRNLVDQALDIMQTNPPRELLPDETLADLELPSLAQALSYLHHPPPDVDLASIESGRHPCQVRLAFEELLAHYMSLRHLRNIAADEAAPPLPPGPALQRSFVDSLPYRLTGAQNRVIAEISEDLGKPHPMMRLIQGDVGSGKTVVAAAACAQAVAAGVQTAFMAPTELLAEQHWAGFSAWFEPLGVGLAWLSGSQKQADRRRSLAAIEAGDAAIVIGTHALFQEGVNFAKLGLIVIDEQHRFGVHQRVALRDKGASGSGYPHQLVMTATPIPRTLAMAAYADLDTSIIDELPPGRRCHRTGTHRLCRRSAGVLGVPVDRRIGCP
jgi:ATP-dependent DNA helicase RecG